MQKNCRRLAIGLLGAVLTGLIALSPTVGDVTAEAAARTDRNTHANSPLAAQDGREYVVKNKAPLDMRSEIGLLMYHRYAIKAKAADNVKLGFTLIGNKDLTNTALYNAKGEQTPSPTKGALTVLVDVINRSQKTTLTVRVNPEVVKPMSKAALAGKAKSAPTQYKLNPGEKVRLMVEPGAKSSAINLSAKSADVSGAVLADIVAAAQSQAGFELRPPVNMDKANTTGGWWEKWNLLGKKV
ncbi:MAG: hypothetical protein IJ849_11880 [Selenomonadaceae bacterium]|nr:hypothetical protein [Selenomonadaceae bacterium]